MSKKLLLSWLTAFLSCLMISGMSLAQECCSGDCPLFIDPSCFDMDYQLFAPVDCDACGGCQSPHTGFYFAYDRLNWSVTRPEVEPQNFDWDKSWGNRFDLGYMTEDGCGWMLNIIRFNGPHRVSVTYADPDDPTTASLSVNNMSYNSVGLNRVWRMPQNCGPGYLEPFVGARWMQVSDWYPTQFTIDDEGVFMPLHQVKAENNIFGGQVGVRYFVQKGRWVLSSEARLFGGYNWQYHDDADRTFEYGMIIGDVRVDASFYVTQKVALTVGVQAIHVPFGIGRSDSNTVTTDENLSLVGLAFGVEFNR